MENFSKKEQDEKSKQYFPLESKKGKEKEKILIKQQNKTREEKKREKELKIFEELIEEKTNESFLGFNQNLVIDNNNEKKKKRKKNNNY